MAKVDYGQSVNFIVSLQAECGPTMYSSSILRLFYRLTSGHSLDQVKKGRSGYGGKGTARATG